jgi:DNA/RNA-binding domain of Phe-tRNA-synthetase-like protein
MMIVWNDLSASAVTLGIVRADGVSAAHAPPGLDDALDTLVRQRRAPLSEAEEQRRQAARDMLRNGQYKPTGRGKPASEYLLRAAADPERSFPRINGPVDVGNFMSLKTVLPLSLWDHKRAGAEAYRFRLGHAGESYVFNAGGQRIDLHDLVVGCAVLQDSESGTPIVNPVKDSVATRTTPKTSQVAACLYVPRTVVADDEVRSICATMADWLARCGDAVTVAYGVVSPGMQGEV